MMLKKTFAAALVLLPLSAAAADIPIQRWHTPQGTQILLVERRGNPMVDWEVSFKGAGSAADPEGKPQTAAFTAQLLTGGAGGQDEEAFQAAANGLGAVIEAGSSAETASLRVRSLSGEERQAAAALANQALRAPRFDEAVFARVQAQAVTALQQQERSPDFTAARALTRLAYPDHAYGRDAHATVESLRRIQPADLRSFHRSRYAKNNAVLAVVGDISREQAERLAEQVLEGLPDKAAHSADIAPVPPQKAAVKKMPFAGEQAQIVLGMPLITRTDPDYYALVAGNYVLGGGGFDSRLMNMMRDRKGYTYGVRSSLAPAAQAGLFSIGYATQKKNTAASLADARAVIARFIAEGPSESELAQAKANIIGSFPLRFDSNAKLLGYLSMMGVYGLPSTYLEDYPRAVEKLTAAEVKAAWQRRVKLADLHTVVVGDVPKTQGKNTKRR